MDASRTHVMIGKGQSIGRHKRSRTAIVEADGREPNVIQPLLRYFESIFRLDLVFGRGVIQPHALIGERECGENEGAEECNCEESLHFRWCLHEEYEELEQVRRGERPNSLLYAAGKPGGKDTKLMFGPFFDR